MDCGSTEILEIPYGDYTKVTINDSSKYLIYEILLILWDRDWYKKFEIGSRNYQLMHQLFNFLYSAKYGVYYNNASMNVIEFLKSVLENKKILSYNNNLEFLLVELIRSLQIKDYKHRPLPGSIDTAQNRLDESQTSIDHNKPEENVIERAIVESQYPIPTVKGELVTIDGVTYRLLNKKEVDQSRSASTYDQLNVNDDSNAHIIRKNWKQNISYNQLIEVKLLRPASVEAEEEIVLKPEPIYEPSAPPLVLRVEAPKAPTPPPIVIREEPPRKPSISTPTVIKIPVKIPAQPRKIIKEIIPQLPSKPPKIIVERWLPYKQKVKVIVEKPTKQLVEKPVNRIISWNMPKININKKVEFTGEKVVNPQKYQEQYGHILKSSSDLPDEIKKLRKNGVNLASDFPANLEYTGDLHLLNCFDLASIGLQHLKDTVDASSEFNKIIKNAFVSKLHSIDNKVNQHRLKEVFVEIYKEMGKECSDKEFKLFLNSLKTVTNKTEKIGYDEFNRAFHIFIYKLI